jgi:hypothetical protein
LLSYFLEGHLYLREVALNIVDSLKTSVIHAMISTAVIALIIINTAQHARMAIFQLIKVSAHLVIMKVSASCATTLEYAHFVLIITSS